MSDPIVRFIARFLRMLLPPSGRRRRHAVSPSPSPLGNVPPVSVEPVRHRASLLRGEDSRLVRPYLMAHEDRERARLQRQRRRALWLAVHGVDVGPRLIHGVEVA